MGKPAFSTSLSSIIRFAFEPIPNAFQHMPSLVHTLIAHMLPVVYSKNFDYHSRASRLRFIYLSAINELQSRVFAFLLRWISHSPARLL